MVQGFRFVPAIGAETTVGYGVVADAEVTRVDVWTEGSGWERTIGDRWGVALCPEGPLCLAGRRLAENIFESQPDISGGVIKGALARLILALNGVEVQDAAAVVDRMPATPHRELCEALLICEFFMRSP